MKPVLKSSAALPSPAAALSYLPRLSLMSASTRPRAFRLVSTG